MSTRAAVRIRLTRRVVAASLLVCILLLAVGFLVNRRGLGQVSLICSLAAGVAGLLERLWSVGAHFDPRHDVVRLTRVHPRFRAALRGE